MPVELKELRIVNWIVPNRDHIDNLIQTIPNNAGKSIPYQISQQIIYDSFIGKDSFSCYDYIELTPKILEKFGFIPAANKKTYYNSER